MNRLLTNLEDAVASLITAHENHSTEREFIVQKVRQMAPIFEVNSEEDIEYVVRKLEERFNISMSLGALFSKEEHHPWLDERRGDIDWFYSNRYKRYLKDKRFPNDVITGIDRITDRILDQMEDPSREGYWTCKGLVVGNVQSGKTANYIDVICKAADSGYTVIIVMAGMLNSLRNQTQIRIEDGFTGVDSLKRFNSSTLRESLTGVGLYMHNRSPVVMTSRKQDFSKAVASQVTGGLSSFSEPVLMVIKKHSSILRNLCSWIKTNNSDLKDYPLLLIDDEADQASVNTKKNQDEATAINRNIRKLLSIFTKSTYLGYTATPFANIFIDPEGSSDMLGDELFPSDFIISLDPPSNYIGAKRIFGENSDLDVVREISDFGDLIPRKHSKILSPPEMPASLRKAVRVFILIRAIRILRGHESVHNSMLINASMFTAVQSKLASLVHEYLTDLRNAILNHYSLPLMKALKCRDISDIHESWQKEFSKAGCNWPDVQMKLKQAVSPVKVIEVNSSRKSEPLDYSSAEYPSGRNLIAVGGNSLSRGLTLEGLSVSYFLRNSKMYDTLLQMGRWFGYRPGYEDLCRIYMPPESAAWYRYISDVTEELRHDFRIMSNMKMTPRDFGLAVRTHPDSLLITARNKMRTGRRVIKEVNLMGSLIETSVVSSSETVIQKNLTAFDNLLAEARMLSDMKKETFGYLYENIPSNAIETFVTSYSNHPASMKTESKPLCDFIAFLSNSPVTAFWDVLFVSPEKSTKGKTSSISRVFKDFAIKAQWRKVAQGAAMSVIFNKSRVGSRIHESAGVTKENLNILRKEFGALSKVPTAEFRAKRKRPLLIAHLVDCHEDAADKNEESLFITGAVAYGISFPGRPAENRSGKLVEYMVNTVWWNKEYGYTMDVEEDTDD